MLELMALIAQFLLYFLMIMIVLYVLGSIGLMGITNKKGEKGAWMAWVPIFNLYLIGKLAYSKAVGWVMVALIFLGSSYSTTINGETTVGTILPTPLNTVVSWALVILLLFSLHRIYSKVSDKANIMLGFTVLTCGLLAPIFLFAIRNNEVIS